MMQVKSQKDFVTGLLYLAFAAAFLWFGKDFRVGTAARMGPGFFPMTLAWLLALFGVISIIRAFFVTTTAIGAIAWKPMFYLTLAVVSFGLLIFKAGLVIALPVLVVFSALASKDSKYDLKALGVLVLLTLFCIFVFVKGLGVPMPIFGEWFSTIVPSNWQR